MLSATLEIGIGKLTCAFLLKVFKEIHLDLKEMRCVGSVLSSLADDVC